MGDMGGFWVAIAMLIVAFAPANCSSSSNPDHLPNLAAAVVRYLDRH